MKDFFISYHSADRNRTEWIAWQLVEAAYSVVIQAWDFRPGGNFVLDKQKAAAECRRTIAVLSSEESTVLAAGFLNIFLVKIPILLYFFASQFRCRFIHNFKYRSFYG